MTQVIHSPRTPFHGGLATMRKTVNLADFAAASAILLGSIPVDAYITHVSCELVTAFNAGTTNVLTLGVTQSSANELLGSGDITEATPAYYEPSSKSAVCGRQQTQTAQAAISGADQTQGGVGLWAKYTQSGTAATTGKAIFVVTYIGPGDNL